MIPVAEEKISTLATSIPVAIPPTSTPIPPTPLPTPTRAPLPTATPAQPAIDYKIVRIDSKITEFNTVWERNAWIVTLKNNGPQTLLFNLTFQFLDADGFILDQDVQYGLLLEPYATTDYTGFKLILIDQSAAVASFNAETVVTDHD